MEVKRSSLGNLICENIPDIPVRLAARLRSYQNVRSASFSDWLPADQGMLVATRFADAVQIHRVENPKGTRRQLTFFEEPVAGAAVCPDPSVHCFLFLKDSAGNEQHQIYKFDYESERYEMLTDGTSRNETYRWSNKGDRFAFSSTMRNGRDFDVWLGTLEGRKSFELLAAPGGAWDPVAWSPDDRQLLLLHDVSANESYYHILDLADLKLTAITPVDQKIAYGRARWARDGRGIYLISDQFGDFRQLLFYDLATKELQILTADIPWDIEDFDLSPDGKTIALVSNEGGITALYLLKTHDRKPEPVELPRGQVGGLKFKADGSCLAMVISTSAQPNDVYTLDLASRELTRWTYSETAGLDTKDFCDPDLIHYPTFDSVAGKRRMIPAFCYRPKTKNPPYPVLIVCHGGPEGQAIPDFSPLVQYYLNDLGVAVILPNVRGSSGYGKEYLKLDNWERREDSVRDVGCLLDWIAADPGFDATRVCVSGGSYGGYMSLAVMTHYSDRLCCGIDFCGISNFVTFLESTAEYRKDLRRVEYGDERIPAMREYLQKISPLSNAEKIKRPMLIVQGKNDPRVPVTEAEQIVKAVREKGVEVWYLLAEDEGHGFGKKKNRDLYNQAYILFLEKFLLKKEQP